MPEVISLSRSATHNFSKTPVTVLNLISGEGVEGDAHRGVTVKHRSRVAKDPDRPNLRQVHLIHTGLLEDLRIQGFEIAPGDLGENILTRGIDLLGLATDTRLKIGETVLRVTGLRNPCKQLNDFRRGLMRAVLKQDEAGNLKRLAGVMAVVEKGGQIQTGDMITAAIPKDGFRRLEPV
ncbi:MOSC domain-containing protein [Aestuariispira insulae]|uniref:MOSC domain-containing protein n=1 Tax=Aestuariispira insulae TaxID=1461337 RepID=A0A3D9HKG0_9PROT|nr:MOSC domain-containing protein [Aestuariispira insulae]